VSRGFSVPWNLYPSQTGGLPRLAFEHKVAWRWLGGRLQQQITMEGGVPCSSTGDDAMNAWEYSKENVLPLARGRNVQQLTKALGCSSEGAEAAREAPEAKLERIKGCVDCTARAR
jgi:hypothetical protein